MARHTNQEVINNLSIKETSKGWLTYNRWSQSIFLWTYDRQVVWGKPFVFDYTSTGGAYYFTDNITTRWTSQREQYSVMII